MKSSLGLLALAATACAGELPSRPLAPAEVGPVEVAHIDARFEAAIADAASHYAAWTRVDSSPNIANALCRMPTKADYGVPGQVRMSAAEQGPHGQKLYYLYASNKYAYLAANEGYAPGFAVVKEAFAAAEREPSPPPPPVASPDATLLLADGAELPPIHSLQHDGHTLWVGARKGLYVIAKVSADPAADGSDGTDLGWVYGTTDATGHVLSAGRIASCMGCHEDATHERLFGLATAP